MEKIIMFPLFLCPILVQARKEFDRGIMKSVLAPKGQWFMGSVVSYSEQSADQYQFLVLTNIDTKGYTFCLSPFGGYFFVDNMATGSRSTYSRTYFNIGSIDINLGDDLSFHIKGDMYLEHDYSTSGFLRTCIGLGSSKVLGFFDEVCLAYVYGQGKHSNGMGNDLTGYYQRSHTFETGAALGLVVFVSSSASVEISVGMMGFSYKWVGQIHNQVNKASRYSANGNFEIDLSSTNLGMTICF